MRDQIYSSVSFISACVSAFRGVRLPWIGSDKDPLYQEYKYHTGIDVYGVSVYTYAPGVVLAVGSEDNLYTVTVQYDAYSCLRYCHLSSVEVGAGDIVQAGSKVGKAGFESPGAAYLRTESRKARSETSAVYILLLKEQLPKAVNIICVPPAPHRGVSSCLILTVSAAACQSL